MKNAAWSLAQRRTCDPSTRAFDAGLGLERENALETEPIDRMYKRLIIAKNSQSHIRNPTTADFFIDPADHFILRDFQTSQFESRPVQEVDESEGGPVDRWTRWTLAVKNSS